MTASVQQSQDAGSGPKHVRLWVGIVLIVYMLIAIVFIILLHVKTPNALEAFPVLRAHLMCSGFGMLGATVAAIRKFYRVLITESSRQTEDNASLKVSWDFGWTFYYLTRPLLGGVLGALSYTLSFVGFYALASSSTEATISMEGRSLLYALSFISGFAVSQVLDRLNAMAKQLFEHRSEIGER